MSQNGNSAMDGATEVKLRPCVNCGKKTSQCCGKCRKEFFCSVICQKAQRKRHKIYCFPVKEEIGVQLRTRPGENNPKGFWVATRDIKEGEKIFTDYPLMTGPREKNTVPGRHICLGCHKILENFDTGTDERKCGDCRWPLCGDACPGRDYHLKECETLRRMRQNIPITEFEDSVAWTRDGVDTVYRTIRTVRIMAIIKDDPVKLLSLLDLDAPDRHNQRTDSRSDSSLANYIKAAAAGMYKSGCQVEHLSNETILRLISVEASHCCTPYYPRKDKAELVIYDKETRVDISCTGNCYVTRIPISKKIQDPHGISFVAAKPIQKGERMTITFGGPKWDGTKRRRETQMKKQVGDIGFICKCARCSDPTEFGSNVSAIKCTKCSSGHLLPLDPLDDKSKWKCNTPGCKGLFPASDVDKVVKKAQREADALTPAKPLLMNFDQSFALIDPVAKFVEKYEKILNPHHYILLNLQELTLSTWTVMTHNTVRPEKPLSLGLFQKIDGHRRIAEIFLHVASKIFPPLSLRRVIAHFSVGMSKFFSAQQAVRNEETIDVVQDWLKQEISHRRQFIIKMSSPLPIEDSAEDHTLMTCLGEAYDNALELCRLTPNYSGIPEKMLEFDRNLCTQAVTRPVEDN